MSCLGIMGLGYRRTFEETGRNLTGTLNMRWRMDHGTKIKFKYNVLCSNQSFKVALMDLFNIAREEEASVAFKLCISNASSLESDVCSSGTR